MPVPAGTLLSIRENEKVKRLSNLYSLISPKVSSTSAKVKVSSIKVGTLVSQFFAKCCYTFESSVEKFC